MISEDKISEIFCICNDFLKEFEVETSKNAVKAPKYRGCGKRKGIPNSGTLMSQSRLLHSSATPRAVGAIISAC